MINKHAGFTLIEMMVTVAIIGILAGIAYPSYLSQMQKGKRSDAKVALNDIALSMQRCFTTQSTYKPATSGVCPVVDKVQTTNGVKSNQGFYVITVAAADLDTSKYTLKATPVEGKGQDKDKTCATFILDNTGKRTSLDAYNNDSTAKCWP